MKNLLNKKGSFICHIEMPEHQQLVPRLQTLIDKNKNIVLEAATFDPVKIAKAIYGNTIMQKTAKCPYRSVAVTSALPLSAF